MPSLSASRRTSWSCGRRPIKAPAVLILLLAAGCASGSSAERDNFKRVMDRQVGKAIDDSDAYPVYYRLKQLNSKQLPNGNTQHIYAAGWNGKCQVGYEVSSIDRKIVKWSIVEGAEDCVIYPPRGS